MLLALDRASVRTFDADGHLHVASSTISAAGVSPYLGREVVDWQKLGLDPDRVYYLFRDPAELEKSAPTFQGKPLLSDHKPQSADDHSHRLVVGSIINTVWRNPCLMAELVVWDGDAIRGIQDGSKRALSCGYRYVPLMQPGTYQGAHFDGRMTKIVGNHCTLVDQPRVKAAFVGDALPPLLKAKTPMVMDPDYDTTDPVERCCAILREAKMSDTNIGKVREHLARMLEQSAAEAERGSETPAQAMDSLNRRFPDGGRLVRTLGR